MEQIATASILVQWFWEQGIERMGTCFIYNNHQIVLLTMPSSEGALLCTEKWKKWYLVSVPTNRILLTWAQNNVSLMLKVNLQHYTVLELVGSKADYFEERLYNATYTCIGYCLKKI